MNYEHNNLESHSHGNAQPSHGRVTDCKVLPQSLVQAGAHHADELGNALQTNCAKAADSQTNDNLADIGGCGSRITDAGRSVAALGTSSGYLDALFPDLRIRGDRCWKVDLCRLLNSTADEKVIDDRQLRRQCARGGHRFLEGNFVSILKYIAWLVDEVHAPPPQKALSNRKGTVTIHGILHIIDRQERRCSLSGRQLNPEDSTLDHILPISRNGKHTFDNIQILHRDVNRAKSTLTNDEFIALCREVVAWADRTTKN